MLYDRTCGGPGPLPGLTTAWRIGGRLYNLLGRIDAWYGAATWEEGLDWLAAVGAGRSIGEIQYWAHGEWGGLWMDEDLIKIDCLEPGHRLFSRFEAIRARMAGPSALWWFRCCDVFGTERGHDFARRWTRFFGCRAAGHTYHINFLQSGLHVLEPGAEPSWSPGEGVEAGKPHARDSSVFAPRTITCLHGKVPAR